MNKYCYLFLSLLFSFSTKAQVGGVSINTPDALESYTLLQKGSEHYLINNCGEVLNTWTIGFAALHGKLLPNGNLLYMEYMTNRIIERDWDGNVVVNAQVISTGLELVYEVIKMPNGNYLAVGRRNRSISVFEDLGWTSNLGTPNLEDVVIEYDPVLQEIVWEWKLLDHVIQDEVSSGSAYGVVEDHPELLDMGALSVLDWTNGESFMINSMDYNPDLDQIVLSVRKLGEMVIIDHSTTTEEAEGHTGGKYGKGGDIIYRWGDPGNYGRETADQKKELHLQHNPEWITEGPHAGKISVYNNNLGKVFPGEPYSSAYVIEPPIQADGSYLLENDKPYGPVEPSIRIDEPTTNTFFLSQYGSGVAVLPNENVFISNATGRLMEVNLAGEIVWEYQIPFAGFIFRCEKYPKSYSIFDGKDLSAKGQVPGALINDDCQIVSQKDILPAENYFSFHYHMVDKKVHIENRKGGPAKYVLYSLDGKNILSQESRDFSYDFDLNQLTPGMYFMNLLSVEDGAQEVYKLMVY